MLKTVAWAGALGLVTIVPAASFAQTDAGRPLAAHTLPAPSDGVDALKGQFSPVLVGTWKSAPDETRLTSDFDKSVWGVNATAVRTLELTVRPNGEGRLRLTKKVVDGKGRVVPASTSVEETELTVGKSTPGAATRIDHDATIVKAVRLYPDDPQSQWPLDGLKVKLVTFQDGDGNSIEIRYDTPEGRGSFWETLRRQRPASRRAVR